MSWVLVIDFGTSYTVAVAKSPGRAPEVLEIAGERRVPSVVMVEPGGDVLVGRAADDLASSHPARALRAPKARLGDHAPVVLEGKPHQIVDLVASLLRNVYAEAVRQMDSAPDEIRLTHPATWSRPRLNRLLEAAERAGLPRCSLVPEPVAAALSYATEVGVANGAHIAVYDLGGGTFDAAVVTAESGGFTVAGRPGGDQTIGGELFDEILFEFIVEQLPDETRESLVVGDDPQWSAAAVNLRREVRRAKETLSTSNYVDIAIAIPSGLVHQRVTREEFETLVRPYIEETISLLARCVTEAGADPLQLAGIYLVGGSTRSPIVEQMVQEAFPMIKVSRRGDPKSAVALGASQAIRPNAATEAGIRIPSSPPAPLGQPRPPADLAPPPPVAVPVAVPAKVQPQPTAVESAPVAASATVPKGSAGSTGSKRNLVIAAGVVAVLAVVGAIVAFGGSDDGGSTSAETSTAAPVSTPVSAAAEPTPATSPATSPATDDSVAAPTTLVADQIPEIETEDELRAFLLPFVDVTATLGRDVQQMAPEAAVRVNCQVAPDTSILGVRNQYVDAGGFQVREDLALYATADDAAASLVALANDITTCMGTSSTVTINGKQFEVNLNDRSSEFLVAGSNVVAFDWAIVPKNAPALVNRYGAAIVRQEGRHISTIRIDVAKDPVSESQHEAFLAYAEAVRVLTSSAP